MTKNQIAEYSKLNTVQEKARFLLKLEITARTNLQGLDVVNQAFIGDIQLPVTGGSDEEVIAKATAWLEEKATSDVSGD